MRISAKTFGDFHVRLFEPPNDEYGLSTWRLVGCEFHNTPFIGEMEEIIKLELD